MHSTNKTRTTDTENMDPNFQYSRWLASPASGEEVVISGMSGHLPESKTIYDFRDNLMNKKDMINNDPRRWKLEHPEIPQRSAKIYNIDEFDPGYFGISYRDADNMDAMMRIFMESAVEAVMDAGIHPSELKGSKTGVFVGTFWSDAEHRNLSNPYGLAVTDYLRSLISHRVCYHLKLKGPACMTDTACSSSFNAFDMAFKAIRSGQCDNALVGCTNLLLDPTHTLQFFRVGVLSREGFSKVFDQDADGYVRGETIACVFLQKAKNSRRIYAEIINTKASSDGFKEHGIGFPSATAQIRLMQEIYKESNLTPDDLSYIEAHGTGTAAGDPEEANAIDKALAQKRKNQLLVASVKSSIGHTEASSGICSIIKVLIALETGIIPPHINIKQLKKGMKGFQEGRLKLVTEKTELKAEDAIIGINNFGFGGTNCHGIFRRHNYPKINGGAPEDDTPRLVCVSGRTEEAVLALLHEVSNNLDVEYMGLLHQIYKTNFENHLYRGYTIVTKKDCLKISCKANCQSTLVVALGCFVKHFRTLGAFLLNFPIFKDTMSKINQILLNNNISTFEQILNDVTQQHDMLGSICVQIGVIDILKHLEVVPSIIVDESVNKILNSYYNEDFSLEKVISDAINNNQLYTKLNPQDKIISKNHHNHCVLNVSDLNLNCKDMLLVNDNDVNFLQTLGQLYQQGHNLQVHKLYPPIKYPVSRGTPMISPIIRWNHNKSWNFYKFDPRNTCSTQYKDFIISLSNDEYKFIAGHVIDGRILIPATQYLNLVWQTVFQRNRFMEEIIPITFTDCKFVRAVTMSKDDVVKLSVKVEKSGRYEIFEKKALIATGTVRLGSYTETNLEPVDFNWENAAEVMEKNEIYKELHLRGYQYSHYFQAIEKCNISATTGLIKWDQNWAAFIDNMFQFKAIQIKTRMIFIPIAVKQLTIDPLKHLQMAYKLEAKGSLFPVHAYEECNVIKSGGVEIRNYIPRSISKKKTHLSPLLEKHVFIPNCASLTLSDAIRMNTQIIIENSLKMKFKAIEIVDHCTKPDQFLLPELGKILDNIPVVISDLTFCSKKPIDKVPNIKVDENSLVPDNDLLLVIGTQILQRPDIMEQTLNCLSEDGYVLSREDITFEAVKTENFEILTEFIISQEKLVLFQKTKFPKESKFLEVSCHHFDWLPQLQNWLSRDLNIVVYSNTSVEGVLGLLNCIRREKNGKKVKCFFIMDETEKFDPHSVFYKMQIKKNFAVNVFKNGAWGTYRHVSLENIKDVETEHCYANVTSTGDLSSLKWLEGPLTKNSNDVITVYYAAINFKDVMIASGRTNVEVHTTDRLRQECLLGVEFSGRDFSGRRVTGMVKGRGFSSRVVADSTLLWSVPESWSLQEAATMSIAYPTVVWAFFIESTLKPGTSVLIHSGTGGVGLAALNVCTYFQCDIYVTVGTQEKRDFLKKHFPKIPESHIGNSHDLSFEEMVKTQTKGRGVDIVLNSLSGEKLQASVRCLTRGGKFIEIGIVDMANDNALALSLLEREASFHSIMLYRLDYGETEIQIRKLVNYGIKAGFVKPLPTKVFEKDDIESAFRYMTTGKHIGKVLIKLRDEEEEKVVIPKRMTFKVQPRFNCDSRRSYIIIGGLGGIGLELADWLILREAKKIVFVSRSGIQTGYQQQRISIWKSYKVDVHVFTYDITTMEGCKKLLQAAEKIGSIDAIFNLAAIIKDALFENQTEDNFQISLQPKAQAAIFLDQLTREICPNLRYFVMFSSVSSGRGNAGQSNYGMGNSVMERVCEKRSQEGFPALAIQWGAINDVGLVAQMLKHNKEMLIGGTVPQKLSNCFEVLDRFLKQENAVVSSIVVAEKHQKNTNLNSAVDAIANVVGIKNVKTVSQHATMAELGVDSMMGTEIIQLLENKFDIYLTIEDARNLTFAKLREIEFEKKTTTEEKVVQQKHELTDALIQSIPERKTNDEPIFELSSQVKDENLQTVFLLPGMDMVFRNLEEFAKKLKAHVFGLQYKYDNPENSIQEVATNVLTHIEQKLGENSPFILIGYSFGGIVALEVAALLEQKHCPGKVIIIDGSASYLHSATLKSFPHKTEAELQTSLLYKVLTMLVPLKEILQHKEKFLQCADFNERVKLGLQLLPPEVANKELETQALFTLYKRLETILNYKYESQKVKSQVHLLKATIPMVELEHDYKISMFCENNVNVIAVKGTHQTILNNPDLARNVNDIIT